MGVGGGTYNVQASPYVSVGKKQLWITDYHLVSSIRDYLLTPLKPLYKVTRYGQLGAQESGKADS